ncbi:hypothetical protein D3C73_1170000 [compost metagenome]
MRDASNFGAFTRLEEIGEAQAEDNGQAGNREEVNQRFGAHASERLVIAATGNTEDHAAENNGNNNHLHHFDENVAKGFKNFGTDPDLILWMGIEVPTDKHAEQKPSNNSPNQWDTFHV